MARDPERPEGRSKGANRWTAGAPAHDRHQAAVDDALLAEAVAGGDHGAFAEIFERHSGKALALASNLMGDPGRAEEVVQEVFVRFWSRPGRYDPCRGSLRNFLLADVRGRAIDGLRCDGRRAARERRDHERPAPADHADVTALEHVAAEHVRTALGTLAPHEREVIALAYLGGHTYQKVATILGLPEGTVKSRIRSGLRRLRTALEGVHTMDEC